MKRILGAMMVLVGVSACVQVHRGPGWQLIFPPITSQGSADTKAPRDEWQNVERYDSEFDCNEAINRWRFDVHGRFGPITQGSSYYELQAVQIMSAKCVAAEGDGSAGG